MRGSRDNDTVGGKRQGLGTPRQQPLSLSVRETGRRRASRRPSASRPAAHAKRLFIRKLLGLSDNAARPVVLPVPSLVSPTAKRTQARRQGGGRGGVCAASVSRARRSQRAPEVPKTVPEVPKTAPEVPRRARGKRSASAAAASDSSARSGPGAAPLGFKRGQSSEVAILGSG